MSVEAICVLAALAVIIGVLVYGSLHSRSHRGERVARRHLDRFEQD